VFKGKQLENESITQNKLNLETVSTSTALATVEYVNISGGTKSSWSLKNYNMSASVTHYDSDLACNTEIADVPISTVIVTLNGLVLNVDSGATADAYFSGNSGATARGKGEEQQGDLLYWKYNNTGYHLENTDIIDFIYLTKYNQQTSLSLVFQTDQSTNKTVTLTLK
jgi:hypothetical protein